ncbi:MAG: hypothetical protein AAGA97_04140 [Pseudomonadota bacterium]
MKIISNFIVILCITASPLKSSTVLIFAPGFQLNSFVLEQYLNLAEEQKTDLQYDISVPDPRDKVDVREKPPSQHEYLKARGHGSKISFHLPKAFKPLLADAERKTGKDVFDAAAVNPFYAFASESLLPNRLAPVPIVMDVIADPEGGPIFALANKKTSHGVEDYDKRLVVMPLPASSWTLLTCIIALCAWRVFRR